VAITNTDCPYASARLLPRIRAEVPLFELCTQSMPAHPRRPTFGQIIEETDLSLYRRDIEPVTIPPKLLGSIPARATAFLAARRPWLLHPHRRPLLPSLALPSALTVHCILYLAMPSRFPRFLACTWDICAVTKHTYLMHFAS